MVEIVLFHSILGLRPAERAWAERLRAAGHAVTTPTSSPARPPESYDAGEALRDRVGWETMSAAPAPPWRRCRRRRCWSASRWGRRSPARLDERPETAGILLLHGPCEIPSDPRPGLPVQAHLAEPEPFDDEGFIADWAEGMRAAGLDFELFRYPGAGHFSTDPTLPDHDAAAAALAAQRASPSSTGSEPATHGEVVGLVR